MNFITRLQHPEIVKIREEQDANRLYLYLHNGSAVALGDPYGGFFAEDVDRLMHMLSKLMPFRRIDGTPTMMRPVPSMQIYPAIDLRGGQAVRLRQGDYGQETVFGDPATMARQWVEQGATYLHLVDLDGAKAGRPVNEASVRAIVAASGVPCQLGGGLRSEADIATALGWGVARVIVGTKAVESPDWLAHMATKFPGKIVLGIDAKDGRVATQGWLDVSDVAALDLARQCDTLPLAGLVYTDISRDGMLQGANVAAMAAMARAVALPVIASGGVTTLDDVRQLAAHGLAGCIVGRALYEDRLRLPDIFAALSEK